MSKVKVRDIELNYNEEGSGFPLILVHGLNGDLTTWALLMPKLSQRYRTIALDVRGHGETSKPDQLYSVKVFCEDLYDFMNQLNIPNAHFVGVSMGGGIVQQFALDHPKMTRSLVLVSTVSYLDEQTHQTFRRLRQTLNEEGYPAFYDESIKLAFTPQFATANSVAIAKWKEKWVRSASPVAIGRAIDACMAFNLKAEIARISLPTLIISGRADALTPIHLAGQIHRSIQGSEWKILEGAGHLLPIERASQVAQLVLEFFEKH